MCGICGVMALRGPLDPAVRASVNDMSLALQHRGPDGGGVLADDVAAFGHRRLAIIDRAGGAQPLTNEDGSNWVVFNGEIYNHRPLRHLLRVRGHQFRTASDTETIVHAYEEYGSACVDRLEGMFAFAIYDRRRRQLFLARDRIGKKPLYYATLGGVFHFASEIKALRHSPLWSDAVDLTMLETYLSLGYTVAPRTVYQDVRQVEPGHWLRMSDGHVEVRKYWDIEHVGQDVRGEAEVIEDLDRVLGESVRGRLESEVPLGAFLSGGVDSGLVVSCMAQAGPVITSSVGFNHAAHNELEAAQETARWLGTEHHSEVIEPRLDEVFDRVVDALDEPFADASSIPTYYVSAATRRHVTVALSGDGGDETFGGYGFRYVPHALECGVRRVVPGRFTRRAIASIGRIWPRTRRLPRPLRVGTLLQNVGRDPAAAYCADLCFLKPEQARALLGKAVRGDQRGGVVYSTIAQIYNRCPSTNPILRAQYADLKIYLPNDVLAKVDRMSMCHGLEVRCPFLDRRLVEFAFRIPTETKMPRLRPKHLLRRMAQDRLPPAVAGRPKHGFTAPVGAWLVGPHADMFRSEVLASDSTVRDLLDLCRVRALFDQHRRGVADHSYGLWAIWMLERWGRRHRTTPARIKGRLASAS